MKSNTIRGTVIIMASTIKEAKEIALAGYGETAKYIKPYRYASKGNNFYEFEADTPHPFDKAEHPQPLKEDTTNTGGKWKVEYCLDQSIFINEGDNPIAMIQSEEDNGITPEMEANANRIVQAVNNFQPMYDLIKLVANMDAGTAISTLSKKAKQVLNNINHL